MNTTSFSVWYVVAPQALPMLASALVLGSIEYLRKLVCIGIDGRADIRPGEPRYPRAWARCTPVGAPQSIPTGSTCATV